MQYPEIGSVHAAIVPVGSRVTCLPPPEGTDQDWLVLVDSLKFNDFCNALHDAGWGLDGSEIPDIENRIPPDMRFKSFSKGEDNLICTISPEFYRRFTAATHVAKVLNLLKKEDRILLFQAVLYAHDFVPETNPVLAEDVL